MSGKAYLTTEPIEHFRNASLQWDASVKSLLQGIANFAHEALRADACSIFLRDPKKDIIRQVAGTGYQEKFVGKAPKSIVPPENVPARPAKKQKLGLTSWIISTGLPFLAKSPEELRGHRHHRGDYDKVQMPGQELTLQTFLGVPIRGLQQEVRGMIKAERCVKADTPVEPFSEQDESTLSNIAVAAGRCLDYIKLSKEGKPQDAVTAWVRDVILTTSTAEPDLPSFLNVVAEVMAAVAQAESCSVFLVDEERKYLTQFGGCGYQATGTLIRSYRMPPRLLDLKMRLDRKKCEGLTPYIAASGRLFYARTHEEMKGHPAWKGRFDEANFKGKDLCTAFLGVPIQVGARTIGVLKIENNGEQGRGPQDPFPSGLRRQVNILVQDLALAILRLQDRDKRHYAVIETASETINGILRGGGELPDLVSRAIKDISEALHADACALFVKEGDKLVQHPWGAHGYATPIPENETREYRWVPRDDIRDIPERTKDRVGLTVWIASTGTKFVARANAEITAHPHHIGKYDSESFLEGLGCQSFMGVPLQVGEEVLGVLKTENKRDPVSKKYVAFSKEDELAFELLASSVANAIQHLQNPGLHLRHRGEANRKSFVRSLPGCDVDSPKMWALGLKKGKQGLRRFDVDIPLLPDDGVLVRTFSLGICGTDIQSFGGSKEGKFDLVEFHEALGEVVWTGRAVDEGTMSVGDIVVPVVRRCQEWDEPPPNAPVTFDFRPCKEASRCLSYRHPDVCPHGEYPYDLEGQKIGYRSRGTGKCHGFGSEFWLDTPEWLVRACTSKERKQHGEEFLSRLILVEPLAVVWKMKRVMEQVRPVRPALDRMLTLGLGPIGYLATVLMRQTYPRLECTAVDCVPENMAWIANLCDRLEVRYKELSPGKPWHADLQSADTRFDIIVESTGKPQEIMGKAIKVLAPNGILVLLSVVGKQGKRSVDLKAEALNDAVVKKNGKIIGSVNESREVFENVIAFLKEFHFGRGSLLDRLIHRVPLDPGTWKAIDKVRALGRIPASARSHSPKIVLEAPRPVQE